MLLIDNYDISITRGDTGSVTFNFFNPDDSEYVLSNNDNVIFSVKRNVIDSTPLINKTYNNAGESNVTVVLEHSDTVNLEYGDYLYDVCIINNDSYVTTVPLSKLTLLKEVNY